MGQLLLASKAYLWTVEGVDNKTSEQVAYAKWHFFFLYISLNKLLLR